jgi:DNA-binding FadR family transcriptional regulator
MLFRAAHNRYLLKTANALRGSMALMRGTSMAVPGRAETAHGEHRAPVEAIRSRQSAAAERAARGHIHSARSARLKLLFDAV